ncbi:alkaline phosphatase D family protein [Ramlibacter monticola]|uniref:Alkaline phosphatase D family protein n=2 Tax=Ramlibacter monticola TaxID=1926872 RepID=A0A936Z5D0_9BURK|nr:alkaline phosphatase D family protein [Ramlibacter monticola]MBL0393671.1 alkaline phosphatase D family protein [Ramlibacter monticola]
MERRRLLQLATAVAGTTWLPRSAWSQPRLPDDPFTLGVASGSPAATSVVLWTRLAGAALVGEPVTLRWEIADDERFARVVQSGQAQALPELAHAAHVEAQGLAPDRWYFYRFTAGPWVSPVGRTRTFPADDAPAGRLRLAYASCQRWEHGWYGAWRHMRADAPDAVVFLGDYIYEYPMAANPVRSTGSGWVLSLDDYRARYALHRSDPDLQAMHHACPWLYTWDDHEVQNDYAGEQAGVGGPPVGDFPRRRAAAYQAWYEHTPVRASVLTRALQGLASGQGLRIYGQQRFGRLATLLLLDTRQYKSPQACTPGGQAGSGVVNPLQCAAWGEPERTMLGAQQEAWLAAQLARGGAAWTVLGQSTLFGMRDFAPGPGRLLWNDGWDGYPAARRRLVEALQATAAPNPVLLGGDVHENWVGHVKADYERPGSTSVGVEFCGTSITSRASRPETVAVRLEENPHFVYAEADHRGYGIAEFTPERLQVTLRGVDDVRRKDSGVLTLARFVVEAGRPVVQRA